MISKTWYCSRFLSCIFFYHNIATYINYIFYIQPTSGFIFLDTAFRLRTIRTPWRTRWTSTSGELTRVWGSTGCGSRTDPEREKGSRGHILLDRMLFGSERSKSNRDAPSDTLGSRSTPVGHKLWLSSVNFFNK